MGVEFNIETLSTMWLTSSEMNKESIEKQIKILLLNNDLFSREDIFRLTGFFNKCINIYFTPTSDSFMKYGGVVNVKIVFDESLFRELQENAKVNTSIRTFENLRGEILNEQHFDDDQLLMMRNLGFKPTDIYKIEFI